MYGRSFNIKNLPPITLENFKKYSFKEYRTDNVKLIEINNQYYLVKDIDDIMQINKNFFEFLVADAIDIEDKIIYVIPLSGKLNIIIEEIIKDNIPTRIATVYFKTLKEAENFEIPRFFGEEIINKNIIKENEYIEVNGNDIILLVAKMKELNIDRNTKNELLSLYYRVISTKKDDNIKPVIISVNKNSKIVSLLGYDEKIVTKKMI